MDRIIPKFWKEASADFANSANGDVSALLVPNFSFNYPGQILLRI